MKKVISMQKASHP